MVSLIKSDWRIVLGYFARWHASGEQRRIHAVDGSIMQAMGYVWGWQDAGGDPKDTQHAWDFGYWHGVKVCEYRAEVRHSLGPVQDEWQRYRRAKGLVKCTSLNCYETYVSLEDDGSDPSRIMTFLAWRKGWRPTYGSMCFEHWVPDARDPRYGKVER